MGCSKQTIWKIRDLKTGEFFRQYGSDVRLTKTRKFFQTRKPVEYVHEPVREKPTLRQRLLQIIGVKYIGFGTEFV